MRDERMIDGWMRDERMRNGWMRDEGLVDDGWVDGWMGG
jgi:hypothetical protein